MDYKITFDGSNTLYSDKYKETFHSLQDGALTESLQKHIIPSLEIFKERKRLKILDICFGLGYNTFATIYYIRLYNLKTKIDFFSPELDMKLVSSLLDFDYPCEFDSIRNIIREISINKYYKDEQFTINIFIGDARDYIKTVSQIDIVYQDPFSSNTNKELWTKEYFHEIAKHLNKKAIITTYSISTPVRMAMHVNNFIIYEYKSCAKRKGTISSSFNIENKTLKLKIIDMKKKTLNSPNISCLSDN